MDKLIGKKLYGIWSNTSNSLYGAYGEENIAIPRALIESHPDADLTLVELVVTEKL